MDDLISFTGIQFINSNQTEEANKYFNKIIENKINLIDYKEYNFNHQPQMIIEDALKNINKNQMKTLIFLKNF